MANMESRVSKLEQRADNFDKEFNKQDGHNSEFYNRTDALLVRAEKDGVSAKLLKWILGVFVVGAVGMFFTILGSIIIHWLLAGKPLP